MHRYELVIELEGNAEQLRLYKPFAIQVDTEWERLLSPFAEALTIDLLHKEDGRLIYYKQRGSGTQAELLRGIHVRIREGGARCPLTTTEDGYWQFVLPGGQDKSIGGITEPHGFKSHDPMAAFTGLRFKGPPEKMTEPHDALLTGNDSADDVAFWGGGISFDLVRRGKAQPDFDVRVR